MTLVGMVQHRTSRHSVKMCSQERSLTFKQNLICKMVIKQTCILAKSYLEKDLTDIEKDEESKRLADQNSEISRAIGFYTQYIRVCREIPKVYLSDPILCQLLQTNCLNKQAFYLLMLERGASEDNVVAYLADQNFNLATMLENKQPLPWLSCGSSLQGNIVVQSTSSY